MEVVLSDIDPRGELQVEFRFLLSRADRPRRGAGPGQRGRRADLPAPRVAHAEREPVPGILPVPDHPGRAPISWPRRFPEVHLLSPLLDFHRRLRGQLGDGGNGRRERARAYDARAVAAQAVGSGGGAQTEAETALQRTGAAAHLAQRSRPASRRSCWPATATTPSRPKASQSVGKKLSSMGVAVIPADCLAPVGAGPTAWHFANQILNAVTLAQAASQSVPASA